MNICLKMWGISVYIIFIIVYLIAGANLSCLLYIILYDYFMFCKSYFSLETESL